jgi:FixJ family two-component response regulator
MKAAKSEICVIDDDVLARLAIEMALIDKGFAVRAFSSAAEFLQEGDFDDLDCVVTDIEMPGGVTGLDLLAVMGERAPQCPVVVMTGKGEGAFKMAALALGARDYLEKPMSGKRAIEAVSAALRPALEGARAA